jgi:MscS family membrane protein
VVAGATKAAAGSTIGRAAVNSIKNNFRPGSVVKDFASLTSIMLGVGNLLREYLSIGTGFQFGAKSKDLIKLFSIKELMLFVVFRFSFSRALKISHRMQKLAWNVLALGKPLEWEKSILGFVEERCDLLATLMGCNYVIKVVISLLKRVGFRINSGFAVLFAKIAYTYFAANIIDLFKTRYLKNFVPTLRESRRQSYVVNRSLSVTIWVVAFLSICEMISTFLQVPLSSTLAFGGVGGLAIGLSARDIAANFLGGMLLLFNEPFTPGDMVTFRMNKQDITGRVERVGWGQTRIRGRDTRPTYVPNSQFVQTAVTNMERITHRKYETRIALRFEDAPVLEEVLNKIKQSLREMKKVDALSMPFRVSFVEMSDYALVIETQIYFATKSIDEFLSLQQVANFEVLRCIRECGANLALPTSTMRIQQGDFTEAANTQHNTALLAANNANERERRVRDAQPVESTNNKAADATILNDASSVKAKSMRESRRSKLETVLPAPPSLVPPVKQTVVIKTQSTPQQSQSQSSMREKSKSKSPSVNINKDVSKVKKEDIDNMKIYTPKGTRNINNDGRDGRESTVKGTIGPSTTLRPMQRVLQPLAYDDTDNSVSTPAAMTTTSSDADKEVDLDRLEFLRRQQQELQEQIVSLQQQQQRMLISASIANDNATIDMEVDAERQGLE